MIQKLSLADLGIDMVEDRCRLRAGDPPFSFAKDLQLPEPAVQAVAAPAVKSHDTTYWGPSL